MEFNLKFLRRGGAFELMTWNRLEKLVVVHCTPRLHAILSAAAILELSQSKGIIEKSDQNTEVARDRDGADDRRCLSL